MKVLKAFREVYHSARYWIISLLFAGIVFSVNPIVQNIQLLRSGFTWKLLTTLILSSPASTSLSAFVITVLVALLSGIVLSFSIFLLRRQISVGVGGGLSGIFIGLIAPACPSCALGLLGVVGIGGFLSVLPFKGTELGILGVVLLLGSAYYLGSKIMATTCAVKKTSR